MAIFPQPALFCNCSLCRLKHLAHQNLHSFSDEYLSFMLLQIFQCYFELFSSPLRWESEFWHSVGDCKIRLHQKYLQNVPKQLLQFVFRMWKTIARSPSVWFCVACYYKERSTTLMYEGWQDVTCFFSCHQVFVFKSTGIGVKPLEWFLVCLSVLPPSRQTQGYVFKCFVGERNQLIRCSICFRLKAEAPVSFLTVQQCYKFLLNPFIDVPWKVLGSVWIQKSLAHYGIVV